MHEEEKIYWYWLCNLPGIGSVTIKKLLQTFETPKDIYHADEQMLNKCRGLTHKNIEMILLNRNMDKIHKSFMELKKVGVSFMCKSEKNFPQNLMQLYDMPYGFYYKGEFTQLNQPTVAIVGARGCSEYGRFTANKLAKEFAGMGITVVSGMALGIDTAAHKGCIEGGGKTVAVLGCGADICYPKENISLYMKIQQNGMVLSEYPPKTQPLAWRFPVRNRIISGISDAVIVVEAGKKSGSLITVDQALEQNKDVYAVPGRIGEPLSEGCNELIRQGAMIITKAEDILQTKQIKDKIFINKSIAAAGEKEKTEKKFLATKKDMVYSCFDLYPKSLDKIIEETGLEITVIAQRILELQLEGLITEVSKNCYVRNDYEI